MISRGATVKIGPHFTLNNGDTLSGVGGARSKIKVNAGATLTIGHNSGINGTYIVVRKAVTLGDDVKIGGDTLITDSDMHMLDPQTRRQPGEWRNAKSAPIVIEDDVFVGARCIILKGVTIGRGSVVAAGSVVSRDIPPMEIWGGNPARFIKKITPSGAHAAAD